jgi:uncharacterized membrane protein YphA (DoxX/SURF4 family)
MNFDLATTLAHHGLTQIHVMRMAFSAMAAVLFLQSSLDKLFNWKGEKEFLTGHFAKSILKGTVPILLPVITLIELGAGICSAVGFFCVLFGCGSSIGLLGMILAVKAIFLLFFGQRVAKDYAGAASLIPYFLMVVFGLFVYLA